MRLGGMLVMRDTGQTGFHRFTEKGQIFDSFSLRIKKNLNQV